MSSCSRSGRRVKRRTFIALLGGIAVLPLAASAQQAGKVYRIGILEIVPAAANAANLDALRKGLSEAGYVEGHSFVIDYRSADGHPERFAQLAAELVRLQVDLIVTRGTPAVLAAKNATATIPIVMAASGSPQRTGVVGGLASPGGNVTGLSSVTTELVGKRVGLLRETVGGLTRVGLVQNMGNPIGASQWEEFRVATASLGIEAGLFDVRKLEDVAVAFDAAVAQRIQGLVVGNDTVMHANRRHVVELAAKHRLPALYHSGEFVDAGGLMTYGVSYPDLYRRAAIFVAKIFKGAKPAALPVEQPTRFELVINLKAAKAIDLDIPSMLLDRADRVVE
jgi:putative ABC transport system substrate-binding protein